MDLYADLPAARGSAAGAGGNSAASGGAQAGSNVPPSAHSHTLTGAKDSAPAIIKTALKPLALQTKRKLAPSAAQISVSAARVTDPTTEDAVIPHTHTHSHTQASTAVNTSAPSAPGLRVAEASTDASRPATPGHAGDELPASGSTAVRTFSHSHAPAGVGTHTAAHTPAGRMDTSRTQPSETILVPASRPSFFPADIVDEYDPFRPNDYEALQAARAAAAAAVEKERMLAAQMEEAERERARMREEREKMEKLAAVGAITTRGRGRGMDLLPAWMKAKIVAEGGSNAPGRTAESGIVPGASSLAGPNAAAPYAADVTAHLVDERTRSTPTAAPVGGLAAKIMSKWGYVEGKGLGKDESGIAAPLEHVATGLGMGVVKAAESQPRANDASTVVLLRNVVGRGQVDDDLEGEMREECERFGRVLQCFVFECTPNVPVSDEDAVRIFVQFQGAPAAEAAIAALNGRFFGGRTVKADRYDAERFAAYDLAPSAAEVAASRR